MEYDCFQIELSKAYGNAEWREDVKSIMLKAGTKKHPIVFLFSDTQVNLYLLKRKGEKKENKQKYMFKEKGNFLSFFNYSINFHLSR